MTTILEPNHTKNTLLFAIRIILGKVRALLPILVLVMFIRLYPVSELRVSELREVLSIYVSTFAVVAMLSSVVTYFDLKKRLNQREISLADFHGLEKEAERKLLGDLGYKPNFMRVFSSLRKG